MAARKPPVAAAAAAEAPYQLLASNCCGDGD